MIQNLTDTIAKLQQGISQCEEKYQRKAGSVQLMAVSKTQSADKVRAAAATGLIHFGENYLQEALDKQQQLQDLNLCWHFIGPIQSNKTRSIAEHFDWVHSVDRLKIARRLSEQRPASLAPLNICLQLNVNNEASKSGIALSELNEFAGAVALLPNLSLRGLMAIPEASKKTEQQRENFAKVRAAFEQLKQQHPTLDTLSMGMSGDYPAAIAEGSTFVRIGTQLFGARQTPTAK